MTSMFRPLLLLALAMAMPLVMTACGSSESEQRAAFIQFLQTRIVDKPGVRVPQLTEEEKTSFGVYAAHYAVITDFNAGMDTAMKQVGEQMKQGNVRSLSDVVARREDLRAVTATLKGMDATLNQEQDKADAARAKLVQPDDLKTPYGKVYDRTVTLPATTLRNEVLPQVIDALDSSLAIADYVEAHKTQITLSGAMVQVNDPAVQTELNRLLQDMAAKAQKVQDAQRRMQAVIRGG